MGKTCIDNRTTHIEPDSICSILSDYKPFRVYRSMSTLAGV